MTVYLDHNASTPLDPRVLEAMQPYLTGAYGNPSSLHGPGRLARAAIELAREQVAALVGAHPSQVVFTGGGTESNNTVIKGVAALYPNGALAVSAIEHASVLDAAEAVARWGWRLRPIAVTADGYVHPEALRVALDGDTRLVSVMWANNETGILQALAPLVAVAQGSGALFHTDAVQAVGKIPVDFAATGAHYMTLSAHKIYGPKGVGALVIKAGTPMEPLLHGGGQEKGRRGGTENVAGIVGFGAAAELAAAELNGRSARTLALRRRLEQGLAARLPEAVIFAKTSERLPNTVFLALPDIDGETLLMQLDRAGFALSAGAACASGAREPSHVLRAMNVPDALARGAVRVSLGHQNTEADVDALVNAFVAQRDALRERAWT